MNKKTKTVAYCGVLTALALIFSYIEALIPIPIGIPGIKLGVANIAIITVLYIVGDKEAITVDFLRIALTGMLFGNMNSFLFSLAGGMLSVIVMVILNKFRSFTIVGVSVAGGITHNIGQIIAAMCIMENAAIGYYLPVLIIAGTITGIVIGVVGSLVTKRVEKLLDKY